MGYRREQSCEPMEIDLSSNSVNAMDISYSENNTESSLLEHNLTNSYNAYTCASTLTACCDPLLLGKNMNLSCDKVVLVKSSKTNRTYKIVLAILFIVISIVCYQLFNINCKEDLNLDVLHKTLSKKVKGQQAAIDQFIKSLEYEENSKILVLYGGVGVGKTLLVSSMLDNLSNFSNIYLYTLPLFEEKFSTEMMHGLILCKSSILIIDNIISYDHSIESNIEKLLHKTHDLKKKITMILVYTCRNDNNLYKCDNNFKFELERKMKKLKAFKSFIKFEPLTQEILKKCIENELQGRVINNQKLIKILKNFNVEQDGCKGVHQKMKYFNIV